MALTAQEKAEIVYQLGWSVLTIVPGSTDYSNTVVDRLTNTTPEMEVIIRRLLSRVSQIDLRLDGASLRLSAKIIDDITLRDDELSQLRKEKMSVLKELSDMIGIAITRTGSSINVSVCV